MSGEMALLLIFGNPWLMIVCLALAALLLEAERWWTHRRRRLGRPTGTPAYVLDGLVIASLALAVVSALAVLVRAIIAVALFVIELLSWLSEQLSGGAGLLATIMLGLVLLAAGIAVARRRQWLPRQFSRPARKDPQTSVQAAIAGELARPGSPAPAIASGDGEALPEAPLAAHAQAPAEPPPAPAFEPAYMQTPVEPAAPQPAVPLASAAYLRAPVEPPARRPVAPAPRPIGQEAAPLETLAPISMTAQRRVPAPAAPLPRSFMPEVVPLDQRRSRLPRALVGIMLVVVVGGAIFFRQQMLEFLPGLSPGTSYATSQATRSIPAASSQATSAPIATAVPAIARQVKSDVLNLRAGPGTDQQVIATLRHGARVILLNETSTVAGRLWVKVRAGDQEGWVSQEFLE